MTTDRSTLPEDYRARNAAVDITQSVIVSAPAGSGKTGLLSLRVLKLLSMVQKPEEILCITFTRKAAAEMQERILSALREAQCLLDSQMPHIREDPFSTTLMDAAIKALKNASSQHWMLLETPFRLRILTIDGFCKSLCSQLPFFSGLGANTHILDRPDTAYAASVDHWLLQKLYIDESDHLRVMVQHVSGNIPRLHQLFCNLLASREQWLPLIVHSRHQSEEIRAYFEDVLQSWIREEIEHCLRYLQPYETEICELIAYANHNNENTKIEEQLSLLSEHMHFPLYQPGTEKYWRCFAEFVLTKENTWRQRLDKRNGFPSTGSAEEKKIGKKQKETFLRIFSEIHESGLNATDLANLKSLPNARYSASQWRILEAMFELLPELLAYLKLQFCECSQADFTEFSLGAVQGLSDQHGDIDLQQRFDYTVRHILIDEFQDTSQLQLELLHSLTREWVPGDSRTLFLVGDGMQSCYGFRNANVGIFLNLREHGLENIPANVLDLTVNFRSHQNIIAWVNKVFSNSFPQKNNANIGAVTYTPSIAFNNARDDGGVRLHGFEGDGNELEETHFIQKEIQKTRQYDPEASIAVLARNKSHLADIIAVFHKHDIPFQAIDIDPLLSKQHCVDLLTLAKIVNDPYDKLAWLAFLRMPCCALTHSDLFHFFHPQSTNADKDIEANENGTQVTLRKSPLQLLKHAQSNTHISHGSRQRLEEVFHILHPVMQARKSRPLSEQVERLWLRLGMSLQIAYENEFDDIERLIQCISNNEEANEIIDWAQFESTLSTLFATPMLATNNPVQCMTMHKSKGLEFDHVFCPKLQQSSRARNDDILYWLERLNERHSDFILSPVSPSSSSDADMMTQFIKRQRQRKSDLEDGRIFYVACTRAKQSLTLSFCYKRNKQENIEKPAANSLLAKIWDSVENDVIEHASLTRHGDSDRHTAALPKEYTEIEQGGILTREAPSIRALKPNWAAMAALPSCFYGPKSGTLQKTFDNTKLDISTLWPTEDRMAKKGTLFHRILKQLCEQGLSTFDKHKTASFSSIWATQLQQLGETDLSFIDATVNDIAATVALLREDEQALWILDNSHIGSACELTLLGCDENHTARQFSVDRTFVDIEQNTRVRWIIDYKTSYPDPHESVDHFLQRQEASYRPQLEQYRQLMQALDNTQGQDIDQYRCALYFPFLRKLEEIL